MALNEKKMDNRTVLIDGSESRIQRPKNPVDQKNFYSGKKKCHTQKVQIVADKKSQQVICTCYDFGKTHDFNMFKKSKLPLRKKTKVEVDSAYQGLQEIHPNSRIPKRRKPGGQLTKRDRERNRSIVKSRVINEHVIGRIKRFNIFSLPYRNRRKKFSLRFDLIAAIYNWEMQHHRRGCVAA